MNIDLYFSTPDIGLASVLISLSFKLDAFDRTNPQKVLFIFQREQGIDEAIQGFWQKTLLLEPQILLLNLRVLKNRLNSE